MRKAHLLGRPRPRYAALPRGMAPRASGFARMILSVELIGYIAAVLTTAAFAPQVLHTWRTRSARDLSMGMLLAQSTGNLLWLTYAIGSAAVPLALANGLTFLLVAALVAMKLAERAPVAPVAVTVEAQG
jgi:MtN3 and saliva related transmembrane protein